MGYKITKRSVTTATTTGMPYPHHRAILSIILLIGLHYRAIELVNGSLLPSAPSFIPRGGSTRALDKDAVNINNSNNKQQQHSTPFNLAEREDIVGDGGDGRREEDSSQAGIENNGNGDTDLAGDTTLYVTKKDGTIEPLDEDKVRAGKHI